MSDLLWVTPNGQSSSRVRFDSSLWFRTNGDPQLDQTSASFRERSRGMAFLGETIILPFQSLGILSLDACRKMVEIFLGIFSSFLIAPTYGIFIDHMMRKIRFLCLSQASSPKSCSRWHKYIPTIDFLKRPWLIVDKVPHKLDCFFNVDDHCFRVKRVSNVNASTFPLIRIAPPF